MQAGWNEGVYGTGDFLRDALGYSRLALTAAVCLSSYLVTKRKTMLFACIAFMFYFFDVASILQDDYARASWPRG